MNIHVRFHLAEWTSSLPGEPFRMSREPYRAELAFEPIPDLDRENADGVRLARRGGLAPHKVLVALGGSLRRRGGKVYLATASRHTIAAEDVRLLLRRQAPDLWVHDGTTPVDPAPIPPAGGATTPSAPTPPRPGISVVSGPPPSRRPEPTRQLDLFAMEVSP